MKLPCLELSFTGPRGFYASAYVQGFRYVTTQNKTQPKQGKGGYTANIFSAQY